MNQRRSGVSDATLVGGLAALFGVCAACWLASGIGGWLTYRRWPDVHFLGAAPVVRQVFSEPGDPMGAWPDRIQGQLPGPAVFYAVLVALLLMFAVAIFTGMRFWLRLRARRGRSPSRQDPVAQHLSAAAVRRTDGPGRRVRLGRDVASGTELYGSLTSSYCVVGPGDALPVLANAVVDAPGPVLVVATRPELHRQTHRDRARHGEVLVYDPQELSGRTDLLAWGPEQGCADPPTAVRRARALAAGAGLTAGTGVPAAPPVAGADLTAHTTAHMTGRAGLGDEAGVPPQRGPQPLDAPAPVGLGWADTVAAVVRCYLHAAAVDGRDATDLRAWVADPSHAEPVRILTSSSLAADGWAAELAELGRLSGAERTAVWSGVRRTFGWLADPRVTRHCTPGRTSRFDPSYFVGQRCTLYVYGSAVAEPSASPLVTAFCEDVVESGRRVAARSPAGRLDPPLLVLLDDAPASVSLPDLPVRLAEDAGRGITWMTGIGSRGQAHARWGEGYSTALARSGAVQVVLGGLGNALDPSGAAPYAQPAAPAVAGANGSTRDRWHLPAGHAAVVHPVAGAVAVRLPAWQRRPEPEPASS